jgi:hypothetical protein
MARRRLEITYRHHITAPHPRSDAQATSTIATTNITRIRDQTAEATDDQTNRIGVRRGQHVLSVDT